MRIQTLAKILRFILLLVVIASFLVIHGGMIAAIVGLVWGAHHWFELVHRLWAHLYWSIWDLCFLAAFPVVFLWGSLIVAGMLGEMWRHFQLWWLEKQEAQRLLLDSASTPPKD